MKLTINHSGVYLDGRIIPRCTAVDIKNISPIDCMEAVLHVSVDEVDANYKPLFNHGDKLRKEQSDVL